jgi:peroxiredoxin (alkyl hydroperoxide reductase subunit C)
VYFVDPTLTIRAIIYYPLNVGRNIEELLRVVDGLQTATKYGVACPANWKPGEKVVVGAPMTHEAANKRIGEAGLEHKAWWFAKKDIPQG